MAIFKEKLVELLINKKILSRRRLDEALNIQRNKSIPLREVLLKEGFLDESKLMAALSESLYIPTLNLSKYHIDLSLCELVPQKLARQYKLIPISRIGSTLTVATADPLNIFALDDLRTFTNFSIDLVIAAEKDIVKAINTLYQNKREKASSLDVPLAEAGADSEGPNLTLELNPQKKAIDDAPIVKIVNLMILDAFKRRVSDIHIEPQDNGLRVRFRVDGDLADIFTIPKSNQNAIIARIKILSGMDTTETRMPQDGRFKVRLLDKEFDFRVSALPAIFGQKLVLRILDRSALSCGFDSLGFSPAALSLLNEAIQKPYGMILVTGPTGSGKSTTLYSILTKLNIPERNIITIEDPVEYQIAGITQLNVKTDIGLTFASGLRAILRQSPDIILIGEIRDSETADIAIKASLTGHLVMATLHTNNASQAITRLVDMGLESFLISSSLIMSSAQRLIRVICNNCKVIDNVPDKLLKRLNTIQDIKFYRGKGCRNCGGTGFFGRSALLEIFMVDDIIREKIVKGATSDQIEEYAVEKLSMKTLYQEALEKAKNGETTLEEVLRITAE